MSDLKIRLELDGEFPRYVFVLSGNAYERNEARWEVHARCLEGFSGIVDDESFEAILLVNQGMSGGVTLTQLGSRESFNFPVSLQNLPTA